MSWSLLSSILTQARIVKSVSAAILDIFKLTCLNTWSSCPPVSPKKVSDWQKIKSYFDDLSTASKAWYMWAVFLCRRRLVLDGLFHNILLFSNEGWIFISIQGPVSWVCPTAVVVASAGEAVVVYFVATPVCGLALFILRISFEIRFRIRDLPQKIFQGKNILLADFVDFVLYLEVATILAPEVFQTQ